MAKLRKLGNVWYARIRITTGERQTERCINLKTKNRQEATKRLSEVNIYEDLIREGESVSFGWLNASNQTHIVQKTLEESFNEYLAFRSTDIDSPLRPSSYEIYELSFTRILKYLDGTTKLLVLTQKHVDDLKVKLVEAGYTQTTVNLTMRNMRAWYGYIKKKGILKSDLEIKQIGRKQARPIYISNSDFEKILEIVPPYLQRVFTFYRGCGARLREPFDAVLDGSFLVISASKSKNGKEREIFLTDEQIEIYHEMADRTHTQPGQNGPIRKTYHYKFYSRSFQSACETIGLKGRKFHSLRHTAAVRHYLTHRDLMATARFLGHQSVVTTEIYTKFDLRRLQQDFPDLAKETSMSVYAVSERVNSEVNQVSGRPKAG